MMKNYIRLISVITLLLGLNTPTHAMQQFDNKIEFCKLIETVMHLPGIYAVDSTNELMIRIFSALNYGSLSTKLVYELGRKRNDRLIKNLLWDGPKSALTVSCLCYDVMRFLEAEKIANFNSKNSSKFKKFKQNQFIQIALEITLRSIASLSQYTDTGISDTKKNITNIASEIADIVAFWRLMYRYKTFLIDNQEESTNSIKIELIPSDEIKISLAE